VIFLPKKFQIEFTQFINAHGFSLTSEVEV
jgi:hypothetical protein